MTQTSTVTPTTLILPLGKESPLYEPLERLESLTTGVDTSRYIHKFIHMSLNHRDDPFIMDEMISYWDFVYWCKHVPNDSLEEVISLVKMCAEAYHIMIDYLISEDTLFELSENKCNIKVIENEHNTVVEIT